MFDFIGAIYHTLLYQPLLNALVFLFHTVPGQDFGIAVIAVTLGIRFLFAPLSAKAVKAQKRLQELQPKIKEIQEKYKGDRERQAKETMQLYREERINPFSSILPMLVQIPVLIALYQVFWRGFGPEQLAFLYSFVAAPNGLETTFLGLVDLSQRSLWFAGLAGVLQFVQGKQLMGKAAKKSQNKGAPDFSDMMRKQMTYVFPVVMAFIAAQLPAAVALYLATTFAFSIGQQWYVTRKTADSRP